MVGGADEALVFGVALVAVFLLPLASWLIAEVGKEKAAEIELEAEIVRFETETGLGVRSASPRSY